MTKQTKGRGLASLIPTDSPAASKKTEDAGPPEGQWVADVREVPVPGLTLTTVHPSSVSPNPRQPRTEFDPDALTELAGSLTDIGFLQPIVVREVTGGNAPRYELIAGERRLRASQLAQLTEIPALVRQTGDDELLRDALLENLQRVPLNPLEEAAAYDQLLQDFGGTHEELSRKLSKSRSQVSNTLRLLKLPPAVQRRVAAGVLSAGHARALLSLDDAAAMETLAKRVVAEGISVRALEEIVATQPGTKAAKTRKPGGATRSAPEIEAVAQRLSDALETRVSISVGKSKGKIVVEFADIEDLHRVISQIDSSVFEDPSL